MVHARDMVADGSSDTVLDTISVDGLLVERREVPDMVLAILFTVAQLLNTNMTNLLSELL